MKKFIYGKLLLVFSVALLFQGCEKEEVGLTEPEIGGLKVSFSAVPQEEGGRTNGKEPAAVLISIKDADGNYVLNAEELPLVKLGSGYFTKDVQLSEGNYTIEDFIVLDSADVAIYLTPKAGSEFEGLVKNPLALAFEVKGGFTSEVTLEVVSAQLGEAIQYGYASFSFNIIEPYTDGLLAYYPFSNHAKDIWNGNNGVVNGAVLTYDMKNSENSAYYFDGLDDNITIGDSLDMGEKDFSFVMKVKVSEFTGVKAGTEGAGGWILSKGLTIYGSPERAGYGLQALESNGENFFKFFVGSQSNEIFTVADSGFLADEWYTIVVTKSSTSIKLYVNGVLRGEESLTSSVNVNTNVPLVFGAMDKLGNDPEGINYFNGVIDEIKIFEKQLDQAHVGLMK